MLQQITPSTLDLWQKMITDYSCRYGTTIWALLYQTEVRARSELLTRTKRAAATARDLAITAGGTHPYDPASPWDFVFRQAVMDGQFWRRDLEENALLILAKVSRTMEHVEGDVLTTSLPPAKRLRELEGQLQQPPPPKPREYNRDRGFHKTHQV